MKIINRSFSHYPNMRQVDHFSDLSLVKGLGLFTSDACKLATNDILSTHNKGIKSGWTRGNKNRYQNDKVASLGGICFAGNIDRRSRADNNGFIHSGLINLDIDENKKHELVRFFSLIGKGKVPFVHSAARSVSGRITGALWVNVAIDMPPTVEDFSPALLTALGISGDESYFHICSRVHKAYHALITAELAKKGITVGSAADIKRCRYIAYDKELFCSVWAMDKDFTDHAIAQGALIKFLAEQKKRKTQKAIAAFEKRAFSITPTTDAMTFALRYAEQDMEYKPGSRHLFINSLAIAANLVGVNQEACEDYVAKHFPDYDLQRRDAVSFPYSRYSDAHAIWAGRIKPRKVNYFKTLSLHAKDKLSTLSTDILQLFNTDKHPGGRKICLKAPTGCGKSYCIARHIAPTLAANTGYISVIVLPLNFKCEKDSYDHGLPLITSKTMKDINARAYFTQAMKQPVVLVNHNYLPKVAAWLQQFHTRANFFIDECHALLDGMAQGYKPDVIQRAWHAITHNAHHCLLYSATPPPYFSAMGFEYIQVNSNNDQPSTITVAKGSRKIPLDVAKHFSQEEQTFEQINIPQDKRDLFVFKIQNKKNIATTRDFLVQQGLLKPDQIVCIYSDPKIRASSAYKRIISASTSQDSFSPDVRIVLCTSAINEGIDLYASCRAIQFISFEKTRTFSARSVLQFIGRWRNTSTPKVTLYLPPAEAQSLAGQIEQEISNHHYNPLYDFAQRLNDTNDICDMTNKLKVLVAGQSIDPLSPHPNLYGQATNSNYPTLPPLCTDMTFFQRFMYAHTTSTGEDKRFFVNSLAIMHEVEKKALAKATLLDKINQIASLAQGIKIHFSFAVPELDNEKAEEQNNLTDLQSLEENKKADLIQAHHDLCTLANTQLQVLLQATGMLCEDQGLKNDIHFEAQRKQTVSEMIALYEDLFSNHFELCEAFASRFTTLRKWGLKDQHIIPTLFRASKSGMHKLKGAQSYNNLLTGLSVHYLLSAQLVTTKPTTLPQWDAQVIHMLKDALWGLYMTTGRLSATQIHQALNKALKSRYGQKKDLFYLTKRKAMLLLDTLYHHKRVDGLYHLEKHKSQRAWLTENISGFVAKRAEIEQSHNSLKINYYDRHKTTINVY